MNNSAEIINTFLDKILFNIKKPGRYTGGEFNQIVKDWDSCKVKVALAFPDIYDIGFSNHGLSILYEEVNQVDSFLAERCFSVWGDMEMSMRNSDIPLFSLETKHPISDFDVLAISIPYESLYTNVLNLIDLARIPVKSKDRDESHPIVIAGGHSTFNPAPMSAFIDAFVIGDGEDILVRMLEIIQHESSRAEKLSALNELDGVYVPARYKAAASPPIRKNMVEQLPKPPQHPLVPNTDTTHNRIAVEVVRGCSHGCRFCQAGFITRPVRERPMNEIIDSLKESVKQTGFDEISLLSLSISDYSHIHDLILKINQEFKQMNVSLSLPSLRIESFSEELMQTMQKRKGNFTLAPESATEHMRTTINKPISEENLLETASQIFQMGWTSIKLYFMIGLPGETLDDVKHIVTLCKKVKSLGKKMIGGRARISVSINTFIPKSHTPFQWTAMDSDENVLEKHRILRDGFYKSGIIVSYPSLSSSLLEGWLSRGSAEFSDVIYSAWEKGAKFDAWKEYDNLSLWKLAFKENNIDPYTFSHRSRAQSEPLPWDFIDTGVSKEYLAKEYQRSMQEVLTDDCNLVCHSCGIQAAYGISCRALRGGRHAAAN